jgi:hypothetical protein
MALVVADLQVGSFAFVFSGGCPSIREKALSKQQFCEAAEKHRDATRVVEDRNSGTLTVNHLSV